MARNNRTAGHGYEHECAEVFRDIGYEHVVTSRAENRTRDGEKVDLCNHNELVNGRFVYNVQCKNSQASINYHELLQEMPDVENVINVILHKKTKKAKIKFMTLSRMAILSQEDFLTMAKELYELRAYKKLHDGG